MTKVDIFSGFLGAGKTTLIKKLIAEAYGNEKLVLIENEFGEIGVDGDFLKDSGVTINEMNSGCICCSLTGDFTRALSEVLSRFSPDRILIEPSGVGKLSEIVRAVEAASEGRLAIGSLITVADASKCRMYLKNFGEFYEDQIKNAQAILLSRTDSLSEDKLAAAVSLLRAQNPDAVLVTTPWSQLDGAQLLEEIEGHYTLSAAMDALRSETVCPVCGGHHEQEHDDDHEHEHHHHDLECGHEHEHHHHDHECGCEHEHHHHDHECGCEHEHHHHDHECGCEHEHHHHDHECGCDHEHHHHADEVFSSWGVETTRRYSVSQLEAALSSLSDESSFGQVLRAKGAVAGDDGGWLHFDYVPGEINVRTGAPGVTGRLCVIGAQINEPNLIRLFGI